MAAAGMAGTIWGPRFYGKTAWALPDDLWGTLIAAQRLAHLDLAGLYTYPTQLVSLPGAAIILVPAIAVIDPAGLPLTVPHAHGAYPSVWLFAGPYQVAISAVLLSAAAAANWTATVHAVTSQPNYPAIDHPTPWIYLEPLSPRLADGQVAAGPGRILAIAAALGCALVVARRWRAARVPAAGRWGPGALTELLWWTALALALAAAASDWSRLLPVGCTAVGLTFFSQVQWHNPWSWWTPMIAGLALALFFARPRPGRPWSRGTWPAPQVLPEPGEQLAADGAP